ncbi:hypothetical protein BT63DRAFT_450123 [Microthyrium microscopicum]|uniref:Uncharacterized protein n=1 Tax=Microthyrium microscopicum TaxID=703497 RepID=A0A6A6UUJ7_9PEZI|nr:hypothetical protein BT63DRAFT_450123 [Microthyrium microscopicum]
MTNTVPPPKPWPSGLLWCSKCRGFHPAAEFGMKKDSSSPYKTCNHARRLSQSTPVVSTAATSSIQTTSLIQTTSSIHPTSIFHPASGDPPVGATSADLITATAPVSSTVTVLVQNAMPPQPHTGTVDLDADGDTNMGDTSFAAQEGFPEAEAEVGDAKEGNPAEDEVVMDDTIQENGSSYAAAPEKDSRMDETKGDEQATEQDTTIDPTASYNTVPRDFSALFGSENYAFPYPGDDEIDELDWQAKIDAFDWGKPSSES